MIIRRYLDPITEINAIRRQINDVFGDFATEALSKADWTPAVRLVDQGDDFVLTVHLSGVNAADLDVQVSADVVSISGSRHQSAAAEGTKVLYDDTRYGSFHRMVNLPDGVKNDQVVANFADGVLTLTLPKVIEARNKVVKIDLGSTATPAIEAGEA
ncbi:Hsp20/alpha crystallin family protein [Nodosilinea sp. LEGE 06152]|uniref:Hsp20/alpha crystallin family protein n=1 Tax=Nodosilinea sp. LEGE 06152 TaxID=2777966 RepID=UPI00187F3EC4|nr:Hsp20/alpha crystallin family protein [Nodosilinea sp. LEGE 06152]MBE9157334.1 Hsp20/alpha crystallin family protein [Nodosilinea sp. LEGE 06152]